MDAATVLKENDLWIRRNINSFLMSRQMSTFSTQFGFEPDDLYQECAIYVTKRFHSHQKAGLPDQDFRISGKDLLHVMNDFARSSLPVKVTRYSVIFNNVKVADCRGTSSDQPGGQALINSQPSAFDHDLEDAEFSVTVTAFRKKLPATYIKTFDLMLGGYTQTEIAKKLGKSESTIDYHRKQIGKLWLAFSKQ